MDTSSDISGMLHSLSDVPMYQFNRNHMHTPQRSVYDKNFTPDAHGRAFVAMTTLDTGMSGSGIFDALRSVVSLGKMGSDFVTGKVGTALRNLVPGADDRARKSFPGEKHVPLKNAKGKIVTANFMGPGTEVVKRVKRGDPPRNWSDAVALEHDINYTLDPRNGRKHDRLMISRLNRIEKDKADAPWNIRAGRMGIRAKIAAEDVGILSKTKFTGTTPLTGPDRAILKRRLNQVEQYFKPGERLKRTVVGRGKTKRRKKRHTKKKQKGKGTRLPGPAQPSTRFPPTPFHGGGILQALGQLLPKVLSQVGLAMGDIPGGILSDVGSVLSKEKKLPNALGKIAEKMIPRIFAAAKKKMNGRGKLSKTAHKELTRSLKACMCHACGIKTKGMHGSGFLDSIASLGKKIWKVVKPLAGAASTVMSLAKMIP